MSDSKEIEDKARALRVHLKIDVEMSDAMRTRELPFVLGVLAPLSGDGEPRGSLADRKFIDFDAELIDRLMAHPDFQPKLHISVPNMLQENGPKLAVDLDFQSMADFDPLNVASNFAPTKQLLELRDRLGHLATRIKGNEVLQTRLLELINEAARTAVRLGGEQTVSEQTTGERVEDVNRSPQEVAMETPVRVGWKSEEIIAQVADRAELNRSRNSVQQEITAFVDQYLVRMREMPSFALIRDLEAALRLIIRDLDDTLTSQVNAIIHDSKFQQLEASWRGLDFLARRTRTGTLLKLKVLNITKEEMARDLIEASVQDQSMLWKKISSSAYNVFDEQPYAAIICGYEFSYDSSDVELLGRMADLAAAANAPFLAAAGPGLFGLGSYTEFNALGDLPELFSQPRYAEWRELCRMENSRYICLVAPHILLRLPYVPHQNDAFAFEEDVTGSEHAKYLWGNAAYALGTAITNAFYLSGWTAEITGENGGGTVESLPLHESETESGQIVTKGPTEVALHDRLLAELAECGFVGLAMKFGTNSAIFHQMPSVIATRKYDIREAADNETPSADLPHVLVASRFAHYLHAISREIHSTSMTRQSMEDYLNQWIQKYVDPIENSSQESKIKRPLALGHVDLSEVPSKPGWYKASLHLSPHLSFRGLSATLRLVTEIPKARSTEATLKQTRPVLQSELHLNVWFEESERGGYAVLALDKSAWLLVNIGPSSLLGPIASSERITSAAELYATDHVDVLVFCPGAEVKPFRASLPMPPDPEQVLRFWFCPRRSGTIEVIVALLVRNDPIHWTTLPVQVVGPEALPAQAIFQQADSAGPNVGEKP